MDLERVRKYLGGDWTRVLALVKEAVSSDIVLLQQTNDEILSHHGKMVRPMLALLSARLCGAPEGCEEACRCAAAAELLHNATLLHDDVADGSQLRRGAPTTAAVLGPSASVLVGDFWLVKAMKQVLSLKKDRERLSGLFSKTLSDLAEGELFQLEKAASGDTSEEDYFRIIYCKTASLFEVASVSAALVSGASAEQVEAVRTYSMNLGLAFQIRDDILDYVGNDSLGKPRGEDLVEKKITLPLLGALHGVDEEKEVLARNLVLGMDVHPENAASLLEFVRDEGGIEYAQSRLSGLTDTASAALDAFADCEAKSLLKEFAYFMAGRNV